MFLVYLNIFVSFASSLSKVSKIWKKIVESDKRAFQLYSKAMQRVLVSSYKCFLEVSLLFFL